MGRVSRDAWEESLYREDMEPGPQFNRLERRVRAADRGADRAVDLSHMDHTKVVHKVMEASEKAGTVMDAAQAVLTLLH